MLETRNYVCYICRGLNIAKRSFKLFMIQLAAICVELKQNNEKYEKLIPAICIERVSHKLLHGIVQNKRSRIISLIEGGTFPKQSLKFY